MCEAIDAVVTWVDSSCPEWKAAREIYAYDQKDCLFTPPNHPDSEVDLCISLLLQNLPWLRYIWVVTMRPQRPKCLANSEGKVKVIHHDEFMAEEYLPTFDSRAIESNLWKITELSANFIYLNDDFYILRPMPKELFFEMQKPIVWVSKAVPKEWQNTINPYRKSWSNLAQLFEGTRLLHHAPCSMTKALLEYTSQYFGEAWSRTCQSRVRTIHTISPFGAAINLGIREKHAKVESIPLTLFKEAVIKRISVPPLLNKGAYFLCVNRQPFDKIQVFCDEMRRCLL